MKLYVVYLIGGINVHYATLSHLAFDMILYCCSGFCCVFLPVQKLILNCICTWYDLMGLWVSMCNVGYVITCCCSISCYWLILFIRRLKAFTRNGNWYDLIGFWVSHNVLLLFDILSVINFIYTQIWIYFFNERLSGNFNDFLLFSRLYDDLFVLKYRLLNNSFTA